MTQGYCVYQHSPANGEGAVCETIPTNQHAVYCCFEILTPIKYPIAPRGWTGVYNYCEKNGEKGQMCDIYDFIYHDIEVDTGDTGMVWTDTPCTTSKFCEDEIKDADSSDWYDWHQMNDTMLIQFLLATLILFCVANLCVFVRRKLRRRPRYAALNKVADSDTDSESILINN